MPSGKITKCNTCQRLVIKGQSCKCPQPGPSVWGIYKSSGILDYTHSIIDTFIGGEYEDAAAFAYLYAADHADRINVKCEQIPQGGRFDTNNGTRVTYYAARI